MFDMFTELWAMLAAIFRGTKKFAESYDDLGTVANVHTQVMVGDLFTDEEDAVAKYKAYKAAVAGVSSES